jgi:hypothetical protein
MACDERNMIIMTLVAAILVSFLINILLLNAFVGPYVAEMNRAVNIFDLYSNLKGCGGENIFFIGSSQVANGVDCNIIDDGLNKTMGDSPRPKTYNLGYPGDTPLRRLTEVVRMIECRPRMVILGLTYYALNDTSFPISADDLVLPSGDIQLDAYSRSLYSEKDISLIYIDQLHLKLYQRKFILPSLMAALWKKEQGSSSDVINFKVLSVGNENLTRDLLLIRINNSRDMLSKYVVDSGENVQKDALIHTLKLLNSEGISVVVINMPLNPILSQKVSNYTRLNYFSLLNSTGTTYCDYESRYPPECFSDLTHLNFRGIKQFSEDMVEIISKGSSS